ncbi:putative neutral sphingomyelinase [Prorops nasuta]|uniref:putative neutral sphingomyelinase n=1 Tax=Prorops nasuta TaxID=863751 RepID=UPI0034D01D38
MVNNQVSLKVLTLNCWGIPYVSKNRRARMTAIAEKLLADDYDVVCLQEVWSYNDFKMMKATVLECLPHSHYFYSGVAGSGVCILSKYAIEDVIFHKWPLNGYVHKIHHGDWFGGKGVGLCKISINGIKINVYIAHLHAEYSRENDEYTAHRILQAFDTAQFIRMTSGGADVIILGGDLNTEPQDLAYKIIRGVAGLADACSNSSSESGTNECAKNSYTNLKIARNMPEGKRIDHILYFGSKNYKFLNFQHPFPERVPYKNFSYSDHEAVMATFQILTGECESSNDDVRESLKEAMSICNSALKSMKRHQLFYFLTGCILFIPLVWSMGLDYTTTSIGVSIGVNIGRLLLTTILCYTLFMSTIWNSVKKNALKAGVLGLDIHLIQLNNNLNKNIN